MKQFKQPKNLQERIFALVRELGMTVGEKVSLVQEMYGKRHVCHLDRNQGLVLEGLLQGCVDRGSKPAPGEGKEVVANYATLKK